MKKRMAGLVALLIVAGVLIGVAKGVFRTGEQSQAAQTPARSGEKGRGRAGQPARRSGKSKNGDGLDGRGGEGQ